MNPVSSYPRLGEGDVHVWWIDLTATTESDAVLSVEERARAARFHQPHDRQRWIAAHVALRQILARYAAIAPEALRLGTGAQGKPVLLDEPSLLFNLTHAGDRAALAVAWRREVGIDLEPLTGDLPGQRDLKSLLASACTPEEVAWIEALPPAERRIAFLKLWALKEAYLKGVGSGLAVEPRMVEVGPHPQPLSQCAGRGDPDVESRGIWRPISTSTIPPSPSALGEGGRGVRELVGREAVDCAVPAASHWTLSLLTPAPEWVAALAVSGSQLALAEYRWPPVAGMIRTDKQST